MTELTRKQIDDACFSWRHDYGILTNEARESLRKTAAEWFAIWQKEVDYSEKSRNEAVRKQFCKLLGFADFYSWEAIYDQVKLLKESQS